MWISKAFYRFPESNWIRWYIQTADIFSKICNDASFLAEQPLEGVQRQGRNGAVRRILFLNI